MRGRACVLKSSACDALPRPRAAHMLRWEGSRLVSHGGVGVGRRVGSGVWGGVGWVGVHGGVLKSITCSPHQPESGWCESK